MYKAERRQKSFYDAVYEAKVPVGHFLRRLEELIDWRGLKKIFINIISSKVVRLIIR